MADNDEALLDEEERYDVLRLEALRLAAQVPGARSDEVVERAEAYFAFLRGTG